MTDTLKANKLARLLSDTPKKYTVIVVMKDGNSYEFQSDNVPHPKFNEESRTVTLNIGEYDRTPICDWDAVQIVVHEQNPGTEAKK